MFNSVDNENVYKKKIIESQLVQILRNTDYSLNIVNRYKENIVHVCAANDCVNVLECIVLKYGKHCLERKNAFGWTPIMHAVRNENIAMVKFLLTHNVTVNDFSFLGLSVLSLASAININLFNLLYNNSPSALDYAAHDDINPLSIAALKNDEHLFFKLFKLGLDSCKTNPFTLTVMKQSKVPRIRDLAKLHLNSEDYWTNISDIKDLLGGQNSWNTTNTDDIFITNKYSNVCKSRKEINIPKYLAKFTIKSKENKNTSCENEKQLKIYLQTEDKVQSESLISPVLSYFNKFSLPTSPSTFITHNSSNELKKPTVSLNFNTAEDTLTSDNIIQSIKTNNKEFGSPLVLQRCQYKRPPNLKIRKSSDDSNATLSFTPQFSPSKTSNLPQNIHEDNIFDELTPTPPKYKTPPRGIILEESIKKLLFILEKFGLRRHIPIFIEQEVDFNLFLTLTDNDLIEIGINSKSERLILLSVVKECKENCTRINCTN